MFIKEIINAITAPYFLITAAAILLLVSLKYPQKFYTNRSGMIVFASMFAFLGISILDPNFRKIVTKADNVPIVGMLFLVPFFTWFALREAVNNDRRIADGKPLIEQEETADKVLTWPDLVYTELICMVVLTVVLIGWSMALQAPLEEPANPSSSPNPSKAPWYFLGLQEMLVYFDPWLAGVVFPGLIIVGLMAVPYIDTNPKGNGYFTLKERRWEITTFLFGFLILCILLVILGTFLRGPNWNFFGPYEFWDIHKLEALVNVNLSEYIWVKALGMALAKRVAPVNIDKRGDRLYEVMFLHKWFAISSILFFLFTIGMVWADYSREWKTYQRNFNRLQIERTQKDIQQVGALLDRNKYQ